MGKKGQRETKGVKVKRAGLEKLKGGGLSGRRNNCTHYMEMIICVCSQYCFSLTLISDILFPK